MEDIESVIFDWGGVLIIDPVPGLIEYCADAIGAKKGNYIEAHCRFTPDLQKGQISEDTFWERVCGKLQVPIPKADSLWTEAFAAVYSPNMEMFSLTAQLCSAGYKTAVLSNTEEPAMQYFHRQKYEVFDVLVFSCAEAARKPERKIYELVLSRLSSEPSRSVFIDDRPAYVEAGKRVGLNTILFESAEQVRDELHRLGVKID